MTSSTVYSRTVRRLVIAVEDFDAFRARYEEAAPAYELARISHMSDWSKVKADIDAFAPYGFVRYATIDGSPVFAIAGHKARSIVYLMGNHTIAETMYRHDPGVLLYAPLRLCLYEDLEGRAHLSIDQPSDQFGSLGHPEVTATGHLLDEKLATLLDALGVSVPETLRRP